MFGETSQVGLTFALEFVQSRKWSERTPVRPILHVYDKSILKKFPNVAR